jgi:hypothetical protein
MGNMWRSAQKSRPWSEILRHYEKIEGDGFEPMREFVARIIESPYVSGLHAITSMHTLVVANTPDFEWSFDVLRVDWEPQQDSFYFEFVEEPFVATRWRRKAARPDGYATFERFLRRKRWFVEYRQGWNG